MELFPLQSKALPWMPIPLSMIKVVLAYLIVMLSWWDVAKLWVGLVYLYPKTRYVPVPLELQDQAARAQAVAAKHAAASAKGVLQQLNDWAGSSGWVAHFMVMSVLFLAWLCAHHFNRTDGDTYTQELLVRHRTGRGLAAEAVSDKDILDDIDWWVYWLSWVVFAPFTYMSFLAEEISKLVEAGILWDVVVNTPALVRAVVLHPLSSIEHVLVAIGAGLPGISEFLRSTFFFVWLVALLTLYKTLFESVWHGVLVCLAESIRYLVKTVSLADTTALRIVAAGLSSAYRACWGAACNAAICLAGLPGLFVCQFQHSCMSSMQAAHTVSRAVLQRLLGALHACRACVVGLLFIVGSTVRCVVHAPGQLLMAVFALVSCVCAACWRIVRFALHCFKLVFAAAFLPVASTWCALAGTASYLLHMSSCRSQHKVVHASIPSTAASSGDQQDVHASAAAAPATQMRKQQQRQVDPCVSDCVVCLDAPRSVALFPCRHVVLCDACFVGLQRQAECAGGHLCCPMCRAEVQQHAGALIMA